VARHRAPAALLLLASLAGLVGLAAPAAAERRAFTRTFEYTTQPAGETMIELTSAQTRSSFDDNSPQAFELSLALEHGITERIDVALIHVLAQTTGNGTPADPGAPLHLDEVALRARYRFAERGEWPVDTTALVEAGKLFGAGVYRTEARLVAARDLGLVTVALNPRVTVGFGNDVPSTEVEVGWAAGVTAEVASELRAGTETWGGFDIDAPDEAVASAGPALAWAPTPSLWVTATVGFGLNERTEDVSVRALIGMLL
jgi:hypothetical protein